MIISYISIIVIALVVIALILCIISMKSKKRGGEPVSPMATVYETDDEYIQKMTALYGEPENVITSTSLTSPTRSRPLLFYPDELVIDGTKIPKASVKDITFNNSANPYMVNDYQIVLTTTLPEQELFHITVGNDLDRAKDIMQFMRNSLL